jgi:hypothetical protein
VRYVKQRLISYEGQIYKRSEKGIRMHTMKIVRNSFSGNVQHLRCNFVVILLIVLNMGAIIVWGSPQDILDDYLNIRENGVNYKVKITVPPGESILYPNGDKCPASHQTRKGTIVRYYSHIHNTYKLPKIGVITERSDNGPIGGTIEVNTTNIKARYDYNYSGFTSEGSEDVTQNCHGYAFGIATWIQDPSYIDADDYRPADGWTDATVLRGLGETHSIAITAINENTCPDTVTTKEKPCHGRIYVADWKWQTPAGAIDKRKPKP